MKALIASLLLLTSIPTFSKEADLTDYYGLIVNNFKYSSYIITDFSNLRGTLMSGRCFDQTSTLVNGSALLLDARPVNGGPIGNPDDTIPYAMKVDVFRNPGKFDNMSYYRYFRENENQGQDSLTVVGTEWMADGYYANVYSDYYGSNKFFFRKDIGSDTIYAINENSSQACYYFIKN